MYMTIRLPFCCLAIVTYCYLCYRKKNRLRTMTARAFNLMATFALVHLLAATVTEFTVNNRSAVPAWYNDIWHIVFMVSATLFCASLVEYLVLYVERSSGHTLIRLKQAAFGSSGVCILLELVLPITYMDTPLGSYSYGPKAFALYVTVFITLALMLYLLVRYHALLSKGDNQVLISTILLCVIVALTQIIFPHLLLTDFLITIVLLGLMVNTEGAHLFLSYPSNLYNELGCKIILQELLFLQQPFQLGAYVFLDNGSGTIATMKSVQRQLPERESHTVCCTLSGNILVVMPLRGMTHIPELPALLPVPDGSREECPHTAEKLTFTGKETVDEVMARLREVKRRYEEDALRRDELTGLLRRDALVRQVKHLIADRCGFTFLMMDLDNFKGINDTYGHAVGDEALKLVAHTLRVVLRASDCICRMGGDEFAVALYGIAQEDSVREIAARLMNELNAHSLIPEDPQRIALSIGARVCPAEEDGLSFQSLYAQADSALYSAKRQGKNQLQFFDLNDRG